MSLRKTVLSVLLGTVAVLPAQAINVKKDMRSAWGYTKQSNCPSDNAPDFILAGQLGKSGTHGTYTDEWAVVGMVAKKIVAHGGLFCPYQIQCANKRKEKKSWTMYYRPTGYNEGKCVWLCEKGYAGENCNAKSADSTACDSTPYNAASGGKFAGLSLKTSGEGTGQVESEVAGFDAWYQKGKYCGADFGSKKNEIDVVLGITKYLEHGVMIGPVRIQCQRDNWKANDSFVETVKKETGRHVLACADGYEPDANYTDCVATSACKTSSAASSSSSDSEGYNTPGSAENLTMCDGFTKEGFDASQHYLLNTGSCYKFFCLKTGHAFAAAGSYTCSECAEGVKGGPHPGSGHCKVCQVGEYFNPESGDCLQASAYSRTDMVYGKGGTRNTVPSTLDQCWTKVNPDEYKACVVSGITNMPDTEDTDASASTGDR